MKMSISTRREYSTNLRQHYQRAKTRAEKTRLIDEFIRVTGYNRKYAIQVLNKPTRQKHEVK